MSKDFSSIDGHQQVKPAPGKWDDHDLIQVTHSSGETHTIAVPRGSDLADFHAALADHGYNLPGERP